MNDKIETLVELIDEYPRLVGLLGFVRAEILSQELYDPKLLDRIEHFGSRFGYDSSILYKLTYGSGDGNNMKIKKIIN